MGGKYTSEIITKKRGKAACSTQLNLIPEAVDQRLSVLLYTEQIEGLWEKGMIVV